MIPLQWLALDALQAGGLLALAATFGADGLHRRDRLMGWLSVSCLLVSLRHGMGILDVAQVIPMTSADRFQSLLASLGYLAMFRALLLVFPSFYPRHTFPLIVLAILPNLLRCAFFPLESLAGRLLHLLTILGYFLGGALTVMAMIRAHRVGDPFERRLLGGLLATMLPAAVEAILRVGFGFQLRIAGVGIMLMAISLGTSWLWVLTHDLHARLRNVESEAAAWRGLLPGSTWHTEEDSPLMEGLFGPHWTTRLDDRMTGEDGASYHIHRARTENGAVLGWLEARRENDPRSFLRGWTVALGMDEGEEFLRIQGWLRAWGAHVEPWGTVPPREGPFPSILVWLREPSILAVWRESDMARRRCRWVQVGGPRIEGPHVRLDRPLEEEALRLALQQLVVLHH
jgi:hypothetical protein